MTTITETLRDSVLSMRLRNVALFMHSFALYLRLFNPWPTTLPMDLWWCTLFLDIFGILFLFWSKLKDPVPSTGPLPYQHQALRSSHRLSHLRDWGLSLQLVGLPIKIFQSDFDSLLPGIIVVQLLFWCYLRDGYIREGAERAQVCPDAEQLGYKPIPSSDQSAIIPDKDKPTRLAVKATTDYKIDMHGGIEQFLSMNKEVEREGSGDVADSESASSGSEDIVKKKLDLIIAGLEMLAEASEDANHKELYAQVMQIDGIGSDFKLRAFDYIIENDKGKAFLAIPRAERRDWLMKITGGDNGLGFGLKFWSFCIL